MANCCFSYKGNLFNFSTSNEVIDTEVTLTGLTQTITAASQGMIKIIDAYILDSNSTAIIQIDYNVARDEITIQSNPVLAGQIVRIIGYKI